MAKARSDKELWELYLHYQEWRETGKAQKEFCAQKNIPIGKFYNFIFRYDYKKSNPKIYNQLLEKLNHYKELHAKTNITCLDFTKKYCPEIKPTILLDMQAHLNVLSKIESFKLNPPIINNVDDFQFIKLPSQKSPTPIVVLQEQKQEVLSPKNDVTLTIKQGITVTISPNIAGEKIIKIIELLKDL